MLLSVTERSFEKEVLDASTPVLVNFWAPWCSICRLISPVLLQFQSKWGSAVKTVDFNADRSLKVANTYNLKTLPTFIVFEQGNIKHRLEGYYTKEDLRRQLDAIAFSYTNNASSSQSIIARAS